MDLHRRGAPSLSAGAGRWRGPAPRAAHGSALQQPTRAGRRRCGSGAASRTPCRAIACGPRAIRLGGSSGSSRLGPPARGQPAFLTGQPLRTPVRPHFHVVARRVGSRCRVTVTATLQVDGARPATDAEVDERASSVLSQRLASHPDLVRGRLENGLEYVILPNASPPERFEAHLEIHAGSVDEGEAEQGIAHIVEHITFLGSKRRDRLLGTGARSNAYTDFHHTVFHVHSPLTTAARGDPAPMLPQVLDMLAEVAFRPEFLPARIEKERKAVLAEAQMMNSIEYRVDCALLRELHAENALGSRFPIGKTDQVEQWDREAMVRFWQRWYFPANATLYLVGDFGCGVPEALRLIARAFGEVPAVREGAELQPVGTTPVFAANGSASSSSSGSSSSANGNSNGVADAPAGPLKQRQEVRPPVEHVWGCGPLRPGERPARVEVFQHRLLQHFMLSIFCKLPVQPLQTNADLRRQFMVRVLLSVLAFRVNQRYVRADPPFLGCELDISDSAREGCAVSTLTITSEPKDWRGAVQVAVEEVRRLQKYGVTQSELERYRMAMMRDLDHAAEMASSIQSIEMLDYAMEQFGNAHVVMDHRESNETIAEWVHTVTAADLSREAASLLAFAAFHGSEADALADAAAHPERYAWPGPTRATAIVACFPAFTDASGESMGGAAPMQRGASMTTDMHVDPAAPPPAAIERENVDIPDADIPEGAVRFELTAAEIEAALSESSVEVEAPEEVDVPASLLPEEQLQRLIAERNPHTVPLPDAPAGPSNSVTDPETGITRLRLSNGIRVNHWRTDNEPGAAMLRVTAAGGKARDPLAPGPSGSAAVAVGVRALSESGTVGPWRREQVELFCVSQLLNCIMDADEEFLFLDAQFPVGNGGLKAMLELLHNFLELQRWEEGAVARAKQMYLSHFRALSKSLERATGDRIMEAMFGPTRRFRDPDPEEIEALTLEGMREAIEAQLYAGNLEVNIVGDFDPAELEDAVVRYLGTVRPLQPPPRPEPAVAIAFPPAPQRHQTWHLKDSDERATAIVAGPGPAKWGAIGSPPPAEGQLVLPPPHPSVAQTVAQRAQADAVRRSHPLYSEVTLRLLVEIMNGRLFTTVRDALGLTYDVSFELSLFDRLRLGWFVIHVTSTPAKIRAAAAACVDVLRSLHRQPVTQHEIARAKRTVLTRHESDLKDNMYRLNMITHLQRDAIPKRAECVRDLVRMYEAATIQDVYDAYQHLRTGDEHLFTCVGTSGPKPLPDPAPVGSAAAARPAPVAQPAAPPQAAAVGQEPAQQRANIFAAMLAAVQASQNSKQVAEAMVRAKEQQQQDS